MFCHKCGAQIAEGAAFCHKCGTKVVYADTDQQSADASTPVIEPQTEINQQVPAPPVYTDTALNSESDFKMLVNSQIDTVAIDSGSDQQQPEISFMEPETQTNQLSAMLTKITPESKTRVINLVCKLTGFGLAEANALIEKTPVLLKTGVTPTEAESMKEAFIKVGANVIFTDQNGKFVEISAHHEEYGAAVDDNSSSGQEKRAFVIGQTGEMSDQPPKETLDGKESPAAHKSSKFKIWWSNCSTGKKALTVAVALLVGIFVLYVLVSFLREFGYLLLGIAIIGGFVLTLTTGSEKEKIETRKAIVQMVIAIVLITAVVLVVVFKPDFITNIFQPGAEVRNAYLTQYSDEVTIEEAFDNFFSNGKWSTYKSEGYSYVVFTGTCEYNNEPSDARITFKITGERFNLDSLDINGEEQNDFVLALMLAKVYEDY